MLRRNPALLLVALISLSVATIVLASVKADAGESESERDEELGLSFFGEVKETGSLRSIENVQVNAQLGPRRIFAYTNAEGHFKLLPNFGKDALPDSITISCVKEGYHMLDVSRRRMSSAANSPVEVDCLLEPNK
jgi:hypothetical protein